MPEPEPQDSAVATAIIDDEDLEEEEDDDDEEDLESDDEIDEDDDPTPSQQISDPIPAIPISTATATIQVQAQPDSSPDLKRQRTTAAAATTTPTTPITAVVVHQPSILPTPETVQKPSAFDDSRRLFQRLWTDEDEIGLLQGFLDYTSQRGGFKNSAYHHDTAPFYDQIKSKLQLDFNKNQLVEKLRRLKKKYRNVMSRINSGKDFSFKTPHDQATFEISKKIWCGIDGVGEASLMDDEEQGNGNPNVSLQTNNHSSEVNGVKAAAVAASASSSRKRSRSRPPAPTPTAIPLAAAVPVVAEENVSAPPSSLNYHTNSSLPTVIEETVRSCLAPLFKELMFSVLNGNSRGFGGMDFNLTPLNFGGNSSHNFFSGSGDNKELMDEKWRKQQILELEVYSKRVELVQDQIKLALEELRTPSNQ